MYRSKGDLTGTGTVVKDGTDVPYINMQGLSENSLHRSQNFPYAQFFSPATGFIGIPRWTKSVDGSFEKGFSLSFQLPFSDTARQGG